jgi:hypothetical protein
MTRAKAYLVYAITNRKITFGFITLLILLLVWDLLSGWSFLDPSKKTWNTEISPWFTFATFFVAVAVWVTELIREWRDQLPKRLTVEYVYNSGMQEGVSKPLIVMKCEKAHLSDIADIRALGQQIGQQLAEQRFLDFRAPYVKQKEGEIEYCENNGFFRHFKVKFTLTKISGKLQTKVEEEKKYLFWVEPFDKVSEVSIEAISCEKK